MLCLLTMFEEDIALKDISLTRNKYNQAEYKV